MGAVAVGVGVGAGAASAGVEGAGAEEAVVAAGCRARLGSNRFRRRVAAAALWETGWILLLLRS